MLTDKRSFAGDMLIKKDPLIAGAFSFNWRGMVRGSIARFGKEINFQFIEARNPYNGHGQEFVIAFKKYLGARGLVLASSIPLNPAWRHICEKHGIKIYDENTPVDESEVENF